MKKMITIGFSIILFPVLVIYALTGVLTFFVGFFYYVFFNSYLWAMGRPDGPHIFHDFKKFCSQWGEWDLRLWKELIEEITK